MLSEFIFHHIGIATNSIDLTTPYYLEAGYMITEKIYDPLQKVNICFLCKEGNPYLELIEPASKESPINNVLLKSGVTPYHICYGVTNIYDAIESLKKKKYILLGKPIIALALDKRLICFLFNKDVGLIELIQLI